MIKLQMHREIFLIIINNGKIDLFYFIFLWINNTKILQPRMSYVLTMNFYVIK